MGLQGFFLCYIAVFDEPALLEVEKRIRAKFGGCLREAEGGVPKVTGQKEAPLIGPEMGVFSIGLQANLSFCFYGSYTGLYFHKLVGYCWCSS